VIFFIVRRHVTFKLRVFHLWQTNFASYEESTGSPIRAYYALSFFHSFCIGFSECNSDSVIAETGGLFGLAVRMMQLFSDNKWCVGFMSS